MIYERTMVWRMCWMTTDGDCGRLRGCFRFSLGDRVSPTFLSKRRGEKNYLSTKHAFLKRQLRGLHESPEKKRTAGLSLISKIETR